MNTLCNFVRYTKRAWYASCCQNDLRASEAKGGTKILADSRAAIQTEIRYYGDGWMIDQGRVIGLEHLMGVGRNCTSGMIIENRCRWNVEIAARHWTKVRPTGRLVCWLATYDGRKTCAGHVEQLSLIYPALAWEVWEQYFMLITNIAYGTGRGIRFFLRLKRKMGATGTFSSSTSETTYCL